MKILGMILGIVWFFGIAFVIEETRFNFSDSFGGIVLMLIWTVLTLGIGKALINSDSSSDE